MAVLAAIGLATNVISAGASFVQANKQKKMMQEANAEAAKAIKEARKRLDVNVYDALTISDTPYERQREMFNAQTQQMMTGFQELGVQGMRGATAALAQGQQMQGQIADAKTQRLEQLEQMQAAEEGRLRDINVQIDLQEAEGAQLAARDAEKARQAAIEKGIKSVVSAGGQIAEMPELYKQDKSGDTLAKFRQDTQGQRNLSMDFLTGRPIPTSKPNITSLNAASLYENPFLQQSANLGLTIPRP